jgi:hypothetical protein
MAMAQSITVTKATKSDLGGNQTEYCLEGTADNVGNNYHIDIQIKDEQGGLIGTFQVVVTDGSATWSVCETLASGGTNWSACLIDDPGKSNRQQCDDEVTGLFPHPTPSLTNWGLLVLLLLLLLSGVYLIYHWRKGVVRA